MAKISAATPEQWSQIAQLRQQYIDDQTRQFTDEEIQDCVNRMWAALGYSPPKVVITDSPLAAVTAAKRIMAAERHAEAVDTTWYLPVFWRARAGWYAGGALLGARLDQQKCQLFTDFVCRVSLIVPYRELAVVSRNPQQVHWLDGRLHRDGGAAVEFADGWSVYCLHGVRVPSWLALQPAGSLDPLAILAETNVEVRREGIRKIGAEQLFYKTGAKTLDKSGDYELLELSVGSDQPARALKMLNPSVPECWHVEFVSPECNTVQAALNFRNQLTPEQIDDVNGADWYQQGDVILRPRGATKFKSRPTELT